MGENTTGGINTFKESLGLNMPEGKRKVLKDTTGLICKSAGRWKTGNGNSYGMRARFCCLASVVGGLSAFAGN